MGSGKPLPAGGSRAALGLRMSTRTAGVVTNIRSATLTKATELVSHFAKCLLSRPNFFQSLKTPPGTLDQPSQA